MEQVKNEAFTKVRALLAPGTSEGTVETVYDEWAKQYEQDNAVVGYEGPAKLANFFTEACNNKDAEILDWGSGTGLVGAKLLNHGFTNLTAVDISQKSLDVASKKGIYKKYVKLGNSKMLFKDDEVDAIVCCGCILPNHVKPEIFYEWARIVKPGGIIALVMRRDYIHLTEGKEVYFSEELKAEFEKVVEDLESKSQWGMVSKTKFMGYLPNFYGLAFIFKIK